MKSGTVTLAAFCMPIVMQESMTAGQIRGRKLGMRLLREWKEDGCKVPNGFGS